MSTNKQSHEQCGWPALLRKADAARYLSIGERTLERLIAEGNIKFYRLRDRTFRVKRAELDKLIDELEHGCGERPGMPRVEG
jgi:excisionase family DNA binding protein